MTTKSIFKQPIYCFLLFIALKANAQSAGDCSLPTLTLVKFPEKTVRVNKAVKDSLDKLVKIMGQYPSCKIDVIASSNHAHGQRTWNRVSGIVKYLVEKGIKSERVLFAYSEDLDITKVQFRGHQD